jgi:hypothetical protein
MPGLRVELEAEHSASVPAKTVLSQEFDPVYGTFKVTLSAGPMPTAGKRPLPIILGINNNTNWGYNATVIRYIVPQAVDADYYITNFLYQTSSGPNAGEWRWLHSYTGAPPDGPRVVDYSRLDDEGLSNAYLAYEYDYQYVEEDDAYREVFLISRDGDGSVRIGMVISKDYGFGYDDIAGYADIPASEKIEFDIHLTVARQRFLTGATFVGKETKDGNVVDIYRVTGDMPYGSGYYRVYRADDPELSPYEGFDYGGYEVEWNKPNEIDIAYNESYSYKPFPSEIVVYKTPESTVAADGTVTVRIYYDYVTLPRP